MALDLSCPDWWEKLQRGETPIADVVLDHEAAEVAVGWFDRIRVPDVEGQPELREAGGEWMRDIVRALFGSLTTDEAGRKARLVGETFVLVPKKNAKTTSSAAIALTFMMMNPRRRADMLIVAPTQKIAEVAFVQAAGMVEADPEYLSKRLHVRGHIKTIEDRVTRSRLMVRTFGTDVLTGCKPSLVLIDEVHVLGGVPYAADVLRQIRGGLMPFPESLLVMISTQSDHPPAGVFKTELQYARGVRDGRIAGGRLLPVLYEFPEAVQTGRNQPWRDPKLWHLVTPNLGRSITLQRLIDGMARAEHDGAHEVIAWATQHLNVEVGLALQSNRWRGADYWERAGDPAITLEAILARSEVVAAGIDGGGLDDLMAVSVIGRDRETKDWLHWAHAWAHPEVLEQRPEIAGLLRDFERLGQLTICGRPTEDVEGVADVIERLWQSGLLPAENGVGYDPFGIAALIDEIVGRGVPEEVLVGVRQGAALSPAIWGLERKLKDETFRHGAQEIMTWSIGNAVAEQRGNAVLITKQVAGKAKIDLVVATFDAAMILARNPEASNGSSYLEADRLVVL